MSDLWRGVENRGIRKGRAEGLAEGRADEPKALRQVVQKGAQKKS